MKKIQILTYLILTSICIFFFEDIEQFLIHSNFSWTSAKIAPYLLLVVFGILIARWFSKLLIYKTLTHKLTFLRPIIFVFIFVIPFAVGFILNPIYEGDFSKQGTEIQPGTHLAEFNSMNLSVIAIPGCPFCYHSISKLKILKKRNPKLKINFIVCTPNEADLTVYKEEAGDEIQVRGTQNSLLLEKMAEGRFPTFIMHRQNQPVYKWSNDQFGCRAMDQLESEINP